MEPQDSPQGLICVQFPGIVKNEEKAIECLGGIRNISEIFSQPSKKRLGLSFQPHNPFVKKVFGDNRKTAGVLLKVKVKKTTDGDQVKREVLGTSVVGHVNRIYKFDSMCDFQYLPVHTEAESQPQCMLDEILPSGTDHFDFMMKKTTPFVVPGNFTRTDKPITYSYFDKRYPDKKDTKQDQDIDKSDIHNKRRSERGIGLTRYSFNLTDSLATEPNDAYLKIYALRLSVYPSIAEELQTVKKMFEERPIWSQNLLRYHTKYKLNSLKVILPCVAFNMRDGPWRVQWVRYGYDPRKEPEARKYQTLDFRLRHQAGIHSMISKREQIVYYKKADRVRPNTRRVEESTEISEGAVYFRPGMVPAQKQTFYQYCDVKIPEVEELIAAAPPPGYLCHQRRGWLPLGTDHICRDHIFSYVKRTLLASHAADFKLEQASSDDEGNSDEASASANATEIDEPSTSNT